jgi:hypothetical protein
LSVRDYDQGASEGTIISAGLRWLLEESGGVVMGVSRKRRKKEETKGKRVVGDKETNEQIEAETKCARDPIKKERRRRVQRDNRDPIRRARRN